MSVVRRSWWFFVLTLALALGGCGFSPASQATMRPLSSSNTDSTPVAVTPTVLPTQTSDAAVYPTRLIIPTIGVNALIEPVGILPGGDMATPTQSQWENVGWYKEGPRPGERGSAVIDGHLDRPGGSPAVFWRLRDLRIGDEVLVRNTDGTTRHFRVTRIALYKPETAPFQDIFGNRGGTYLNLITCAGDWIPSERQTTLRLVVYTSLE